MKFPDVEENKWYTEAVDKASDAGIMIGDEKGNFRPETALTRAEAAMIVCRLLDKINEKADLVGWLGEPGKGCDLHTGTISLDEMCPVFPENQ